MDKQLSLQDIKAVLFDVDGTLVDSLEMLKAGLGDTFEQWSGVRPTDAELIATMGVPLIQQFEIFVGRPLLEAERQRYLELALSNYRANYHKLRNFEPAFAALKECSEAGLKIALVTSKNQEELKDFLDHFSHAPYLTATVCASDVLNPKPAADPALLACDKLGVSPHEAVFIGDSLFDLHCARAAGTMSVAVAYGASSRDTLASELPDVLLDTPEDLLEWVRQELTKQPCHARN